MEDWCGSNQSSATLVCAFLLISDAPAWRGDGEASEDRSGMLRRVTQTKKCFIVRFSLRRFNSLPISGKAPKSQHLSALAKTFSPHRKCDFPALHPRPSRVFPASKVHLTSRSWAQSRSPAPAQKDAQAHR